MKTIRIQVRGRVQGVYYRQSTCRTALELGIKGWVKNCPDGSVELLATGTEQQLTALQEWCSRGPVRAVVESMEVQETDLQHFPDFVIAR